MFYFTAICLAIWLILTLHEWLRKRSALRQVQQSIQEENAEWASTLEHVCLSTKPASTFLQDGQKITLEAHRIADIVLTSGRIIAGDALVPLDHKPFTRRAPVGTFPVILTLSEIDGDARVAFAAIEFSQKKIVRWEPASPEDMTSLAKITGFTEGFPVDSWHAAFLDADAYPAWSAGKISLEAEHEANNGQWNQHVFPETRANMVTFFSGYGSGYYTCYFGCDADAKPVALVASFDVLTGFRKYREIKERTLQMKLKYGDNTGPR